MLYFYPYVSIYTGDPMTGMMWYLTHYGFLMSYDVPDGTTPLPVDYSSLNYCGIHPKEISQEMQQMSIADMSLKISHFRLQLHPQRAIELI